MTRKKTHKQNFGTHPIPGQSRKFVYVYVFFLSQRWGQQLFTFQSPAVHWIARTSSLNCFSCRNPYQTPHSVNCLPPFHWKPLFSLKSASSHPFPKNRLWQSVSVSVSTLILQRNLRVISICPLLVSLIALYGPRRSQYINILMGIYHVMARASFQNFDVMTAGGSSPRMFLCKGRPPNYTQKSFASVSPDEQPSIFYLYLSLYIYMCV